MSQTETVEQDLAGNPEPDLRPLSKEEKSQVDANPDAAAFLNEAYWTPTKPISTLERAGLQGTAWLKQYQQKTKSDSLIQFKQKWIHFCVKRYIPFAFPYPISRDRFSGLRINTTIDYLDVLYYAALHPHLIGAFAETRDKQGKVRHVFKYLEKSEVGNEPGIIYCRKIMAARGMVIQSATTTEEKPVTPERKEVVPTAEEDKEIKESADKAATEANELKPKPKPPRTALQKNDATVARRQQPDYKQAEPPPVEGREAIYTGGFDSRSRPTNWRYTLPNGKSGNMSRAVSKRFNKMVESLEMNISGSNNITVGKEEWTDVTNLAIQNNVYDTRTDPDKKKFIYRIKVNQGQNIAPKQPPVRPESGNGQIPTELISYENIAKIYLGSQHFANRIAELGNTRGDAQKSQQKATIRFQEIEYYRSHGIAGIRRKIVGEPPNQKTAYTYVVANDPIGKVLEVREPERTPREVRAVVRQGGNRTYFLEKRVKTESPLEDVKPAQKDEDANNKKTATEAVNFDDWKTNVPKEKGEIFAYFNPRVPTDGDGSYWAVGTASGSIITKQEFEQQRAAERLRFYNAICRRFGRPETEDFPQAIEHDFIANYPERPNAQALMRLFIEKDEFLDASKEQSTSLDILTISRAIKASDKRSKKKFSHSIKQLSDLGLKVHKVFVNYNEIINGPVSSNRGKKEREIGMRELHIEANTVNNFHNRVREFMEEQKVEFSEDDQIEFCLTDDFKLLHIIHKSKVYFSGFHRDTIENEIGAAFNVENEPFPEELLSGKKIIDKAHNQTTFGYLYFAEEIIKQENKIGKKDLMPWPKFLQLYTFPVPEINPDKAKPVQGSDEESPTEIETNVSGDGVATGQGVTNSLEPRSVTEGSLFAYENDPEKEEKESARSSRVKNLEIKAQDAVLNCDNLPELAKQIKSIEDIFDIVLDRITLLELFGELANKSLQDLKKNFALLDLVEGFSPEGLNAFSDRFDKFVDDELSCVMDFVGKSLVEELFNGIKLEDLDINNLEDVISPERVSNYFGINIPLIPIMGLLDFIRKIVKEAIEKALTEVLLALVIEGLESFLGCDGLPASLADDLAAKLPDPNQALNFGAKKLNDFLKDQGIDLEAVANKLNSSLENLENFMEVLSATLNAAEIRSLLEGDPGTILLAIVEELMERFGLDPAQGKNTFKDIGQSIPRSALLDFVPEKYYVEFCDERDFVNAAQISKDLLRNKGLTDEDQKNQALDNIEAATEKLKSLCDLKSLAEDGLANALAGIPMPSVLSDIQGSSETALQNSMNSSVFIELEKFMLASSKSGGLFSGGDRISCITMGNENEQTKLLLFGDDPDREIDNALISYSGQIGQYQIGNLRLYLGQQDETEFDSPNKIIIYRKGVNLQQILSNPTLAKDDRNVLVNLTMPSIIDSNPIENYGSRDRDPIDLLPESRIAVNTQLIHGFGFSKRQIVSSFNKADAILRPPTAQEAGSYPKPFLDNIVYDRGDGLEFLNAAFSFPFGREKPDKSPRQQYIESPLFDIETAYNILYSKIEDAPTLINAGPNFEKKTKRKNMLSGISARVYPYFCSIWPIFSDSRSLQGFRGESPVGRIQFASSDAEITNETEGRGGPDIIMRKMIVNYLARKIRFDLEDERLDEVYNKVIQEDYSLEEVIDAIIEPLFSDPINNKENLYRLSPEVGGGGFFDYGAVFKEYYDLLPQQIRIRILESAQAVSPPQDNEVDYLERIFAEKDSLRAPGEPEVPGYPPDNVYSPIQALCAMATIYLDASTNIDSLIGTTFSSTKNTADTILKKMVSISEGSFK